MRRFSSALSAFLLLCPLVGAEERASQEMVGRVTSYAVREGDTLSAIGARFGIGWQVLADENALASPDRLDIGQSLRIDNRHIVPQGALQSGIVVNIPQRMLFYRVDGQVVRSYPAGLGRTDWPTPMGLFEVTSRDENPAWLVPASIQEEMIRRGVPLVREVPPGPGNPLGAYRLRLDNPAYSIHGTNAPASIYGFPSHGCIRLHPEDIADLFALVARGTPVQILYETVLVAVLPDGTVYLEAHPDIYGMVELGDPAAGLIRERGLWSISPDAIRDSLRAVDGVARRVSASEDR